MRAALVLLFAVGVSSMTLHSTNETSIDESDYNVSILTGMIDNIKDQLEDIIDIQKEIVKQNCQKSNEMVMQENDSDMESPRIICHTALTTRYQDCRTMCNALPSMGSRIMCNNENWWSYLNKCFGGFRYMNCPAVVTISSPPPTPSNTPGPTSGPSGLTVLKVQNPGTGAAKFDGDFFYTTRKMTRSAAKIFCEEKFGFLAEPSRANLDKILIQLNLVFGDQRTNGYWLGAKKNNDAFRFETSGNRLSNNVAAGGTKNWWFQKADSGILCPFTNCPSDCSYLTPEKRDANAGPVSAVRSCATPLYPLCENY